MLDSGEFHSFTNELANGTTVTAHRLGYIHIHIAAIKLSLGRAYFIPDIKLHLLSCSRLDDRRVKTIIVGRKKFLRDGDNRNSILGVIERRKIDGLYAATIVQRGGTHRD